MTAVVVAVRSDAGLREALHRRCVACGMFGKSMQHEHARDRLCGNFAISPQVVRNIPIGDHTRRFDAPRESLVKARTGLEMRAVVQRVSEAAVRVGTERVGAIERGYLVLLGVSVDDDDGDARTIANKIAGLRIFDDAGGAMNLALAEIGGAVLLVSQFTLLGDARKGRRPSFIAAARGERANELYERVASIVREHGLHVETGRFGADMAVALVNDGPVTILLDTKRAF